MQLTCLAWSCRCPDLFLVLCAFKFHGLCDVLVMSVTERVFTPTQHSTKGWSSPHPPHPPHLEVMLRCGPLFSLQGDGSSVEVGELTPLPALAVELDDPVRPRGLAFFRCHSQSWFSLQQVRKGAREAQALWPHLDMEGRGIRHVCQRTCVVTALDTHADRIECDEHSVIVLGLTIH